MFKDHLGSFCSSEWNTAAAAVGFMLARVLPVGLSIALIAGLELLLVFSIHDDFTLNIMQLVCPNALLSDWQVARSPHLAAPIGTLRPRPVSSAANALTVR